jgi:hypothetical protein
MTSTEDQTPRRSRGFQPASGLLRDRIRAAGEARGFAVARLLTHWSEIVGEDIAAIARPAKVGYGREGFGATLTLLTIGASAPILQMQLPKIRDKVNACYGYNAISQVKITQTAPIGFAEGQVAFTPAPKKPAAPAPEIARAAADMSQGVADTGLREALAALGQNVLSRTEDKKG